MRCHLCQALYSALIKLAHIIGVYPNSSVDIGVLCTHFDKLRARREINRRGNDACDPCGGGARYDRSTVFIILMEIDMAVRIDQRQRH
jgi:hypothetical protein